MQKNKIPQGVFHLVGVLGLPSLLVSVFLLESILLSTVISLLIVGVLLFIYKYNR